MRTIDPTGSVFFGSFKCTQKATSFHRSESPLSQTTRGHSPSAHTSALGLWMHSGWRWTSERHPVCVTQASPFFQTAWWGIHQNLQSNCARQVLLLSFSSGKSCEMAMLTWSTVWWLARSQSSLTCYLRYLKLKSNQICCFAGLSLLQDEFLSKSI